MRIRPHLVRWFVGVVVFLTLAGWSIEHTFPALPLPVTLTVAFPAGHPEESQPLVTTGIAGAGDFLFVRSMGAGRVVFGYDSWGVGGPVSAPVSIATDRPCRLEIEMPSLARLAPPAKSERGRLRLTLDGREVLNHEVSFRGRTTAQVWFGENPLGGTSTGPQFRGTMTTGAGQAVHGLPRALVPRSVRLGTWLTTKSGQFLALAALSLAAILVVRRAVRSALAFLRESRLEPPRTGFTNPPHAWFLATTAACAWSFVTVISGGTYRLVFPETFGSFYDHQAASLLAGRLDVPEPALSAEAFIFEGKYYGYFGPTPALLRMPFVMAGVAFGRLSRSYMVFYYVVSLAAVYALLIQASRHLSQRATWPSAFQAILVVGSAGAGSTLFFTASRAYVYHEAILCGAMFALWSTWFSLRYLEAESGPRWWLAALGCGLLALHSRPPAGLFALGLLGVVAANHLFHAWRSPAGQLRPSLSVGLFAVAGVLSFSGLSYLKFKSFAGAPLRYHIQYHPDRLAVTGGSNFHLRNFRFNFDSYLWRPSFELRPGFPWFFITGADPAEYSGSRIDLAEQTLSLPCAMPALTLLALIAAGSAVFRWPDARRPLAMLVLGALPMTLALLTAIAISHRYTADFVPPLVAAAAFGAAALPVLPPGLRRGLAALLVALAVIGIAITAAVTLHYQGEGVWGVPDEIRGHYHSIRQQFNAFFGVVPT